MLFVRMMASACRMARVCVCLSCAPCSILERSEVLFSNGTKWNFCLATIFGLKMHSTRGLSTEETRVASPMAVLIEINFEMIPSSSFSIPEKHGDAMSSRLRNGAVI